MRSNGVIDLKQRIVSEGLRLFLRKGFRNTTVNDIIDAAGISKGAFYWHFKSKNELLETIMNEFENSFLDKFIEAVEKAPGDFRTKFKYYHKYITEFAFNNMDLCVGFMTIAAELAGNGTILEERMRGIYEKYRDFLKRLISRGRMDSALKDDLDVDMAAHVVMAINDGMLLQWYMNRNTIDSRLFAKTYRDITLNGILKGS
jgi:AcrR family transcriptional regulator